MLIRKSTESEEGNMAKNQKTLENQYHMVVARCKDLAETMGSAGSGVQNNRKTNARIV